MFFEALYFGHFLSFYTMQLEPPKSLLSPTIRLVLVSLPLLCKHMVTFIPFIALIRTCLICVGVLSETVGFRVVCLDTF